MVFPFFEYPLCTCRIAKVACFVNRQVPIFVLRLEYLIYFPGCNGFLKNLVDNLGVIVCETFADGAHEVKLVYFDRSGLFLAASLAALGKANTEGCFETNGEKCAHSFISLFFICLFVENREAIKQTVSVKESYYSSKYFIFVLKLTEHSNLNR